MDIGSRIQVSSWVDHTHTQPDTQTERLNLREETSRESKIRFRLVVGCWGGVWRDGVH